MQVRNCFTGTAYVLAVMLSFNAAAIDLTGFKFTESYRYAFLDDAGLEEFKTKHLLMGSFSYIKTPLFVSDTRFNNLVSPVINSYNLLNLGYSYKYSKDLALALETKFARTALASRSETSIGDVALKARLKLLNHSSSEKNNELVVSVRPELILPTGKLESFSTKKEVAAGLLLVAEKRWDHLFFLLGLGYKYAPKNQYSIIDYRNVVALEFGLSYDLNEKVNLNFETNRHFTLASDYRQDEGDYYLTIKHKTMNDLASYAGFGLSGVSELERKNWTVFAGVKINFGDNGKQVTPVALPVVEKRKLVEVKKEDIQEKAVAKIESSPRPITQIVLKNASDEKKKLGDAFVIDNIYFANAKWDITDTEQTKVDDLVRKISERKGRVKHIVIEGYASKVGNAKLNQKLSLKRAQNVQAKLIGMGILKEMTSLVAYGDRSQKQDPDVAKNRKVQFRVYLD